MLFNFGRLCLFFEFVLLETAAVRVATAAILDGEKALEMKYLLLKLSFDIDHKVFDLIKLFLSFLLHKGLFDFQFLLFSHLHHNFLHPCVHLFFILLLADEISVHPWVFHHSLQSYPLFGVRVQHLFDEI